MNLDLKQLKEDLFLLIFQKGNFDLQLMTSLNIFFEILINEQKRCLE